MDKHIGDCVMAVFGAPVAYGNDPKRCVRAALEIGCRMPILAAELGCIQCRGLNLFFATHRLNERLGAMLSA